MKLSFNISEIESTMKTQVQKQTATSKSFTSRPHVKQQVDIRGHNIDEGIMEVDKYLDNIYLSGLSEVSIIHGKGTGKLREGIHEYLKKNPYVASYRLGVYGEGEAGITVVSMKMDTD